MDDTPAPASPSSTAPAADTAAGAGTAVECLGPRQVAAALDRHAVVVDIRESFERHAAGRIPGAVAVPVGLLAEAANGENPGGHRVLDPRRLTIVCGESDERSTTAALALQQLGFVHVARLDGGFDAWTACGYPVEPAPRLPTT